MTSLNRRDFVGRIGTSALVAGAGGILIPRAGLHAAPGRDSKAETAAAKLYETLSDSQKKAVCFGFDHPSRTKINANWAISKPRIVDDFYSDEQRGLIAEIFKNVTSEDGHKRFMKQTDDDDGGWDAYHIAMFGTPDSDQFEWAMTGRHLTIRADGNTVEGVAFGGPIVYGHGEEEAKENVFYYQTLKANEVFAALDSEQRKAAMLTNAPGENKVQLQGRKGSFPGLRVGDMSEDQLELVESVIKTLLAPYREEDVKEAIKMIKKGGGLQNLRMAFYTKNDLGNDKVWDIWRIEGPTFVCHFRGAPHVHAYLNVGTRKA